MYLFTDDEIDTIAYELEDAGDIFKLLYYAKERIEKNPRSPKTKRALNFVNYELVGYIDNMEDMYIMSDEKFDVDISSRNDWEPSYKSVRGRAPRYILGVLDLPGILKDISLKQLEGYFHMGGDDKAWETSDKIFRELLLRHPEYLDLSDPDFDNAKIEEDEPEYEY